METPPVQFHPPVAVGPAPGRGPWPFGLSMACLALMIAYLVVVQLVAFAIPYAVELLSKAGGNGRPDMNAVMPIGTILIWAQVACVISVPPLAWLLAWLRGTGDTAAYMGFRGFRWSDLGLGIAGVVAVGFVSEFLITAPNGMMKQVFDTAEPRWLFCVAVAVFAPVIEEIVFRGFVFDGLRNVNPWAATLITSALWTGIHLQYDLREMSIIFLLGLVLGGVRIRSGSVWLCILLHTLNNAASVVYFIRESK